MHLRTKICALSNAILVKIGDVIYLVAVCARKDCRECARQCVRREVQECIQDIQLWLLTPIYVVLVLQLFIRGVS